MRDAEALDEIITNFINYVRPEIRDFQEAIETFKEDLPTILNSLRDLIDNQGENNTAFKTARNKFWEICQESINPEITLFDIREMMIQHILTEDIFHDIFNESQFHTENNIARELQEVISTFFTGSLKRNTLGTIERYYAVIRRTAAKIYNHQEKQKFLKALYENFYQAYNPQVADRLGVVYTPNEIVRFMIESVDFLVHKHFGKLLADKDVQILDPATGTGTFISELIDYLPKHNLEHKYKHEIHCNEVAILPYYIANLNIEYTYKQKMGVYEEFENICFVDTLDNNVKIKNQNYHINNQTISVIIGNPPYNANQQNENDNNKNRTYPAIDKLIKESYVKYSKAQKTKAYDMYVRFYRWATDRIKNGIICFITNSSFLDGRAFDGFRKCIQNDFSFAYFLDLGGNVRAISGKDGIFIGENHTIFGKSAMTGIVISFLVKDSNPQGCKIFYSHPFHVHELRENKLRYLASTQFENIDFQHIIPDVNYNWINLADTDFQTLPALVNKNVKDTKNNTEENAIFKFYTNGIKSNRDDWVYDLNKDALCQKIKFFIDFYNSELEKYKQAVKVDKLDDFVDYTIKWSRDLKRKLLSHKKTEFAKYLIKLSLYRPFITQYFYCDFLLNDVLTTNHLTLFGKNFEKNNIIIYFSGTPLSKPFQVFASEKLCDYHFLEQTQCLPLYRYDKEGNRIDNITDWGLKQFQTHYQDTTITKIDIFHYTYAVLHHPAYLKKYELNLKRDFPRLPYYENFSQWVNWGKQLMEIHINYETVTPYQLTRVDIPLKNNQKTPKPKLKADKNKGMIIVDDITTLQGIPNIAWSHKFGNRCALEWILDQYKEKNPKDSTITEKFNNYCFADYKEQVIDLLMKVCNVSVETMNIIQAMSNK